MKVVFDTNVAISALLWNGTPRKLLKSPGIEPFTSAPLLAELYGVLSRSKFRAKIAAAGSSADQLLMLYAGAAMTVRPAAIPPTAPDPDDDVVIGTAVAAGAEFIVTGDKPLLTVKSFEGVRVITVQRALEMLAAI